MIAAMRTRTLFAALAGAALFTAPAAADIYAVAIGVDAYQTLPKLSGAVNDARDIAGALRALGGNVVALENEAATREAVLAAIRAQSSRAEPGDLFVLTYAGHGIQEPEAIPGDEVDGKDESIVFADFAFEGPKAGERLRDNEIGALLAEIDPAVRKLIVVDSCHSGTMTRAFDRRGRSVATRFGGLGRISKDPLEPPAAASKGQDLAGRNTVFVAAARDEEQIPEVVIDGETRGAVSWSVARALEGADDFGGPDMPLDRFRDYVRAQSRALSATRQTPDVVFDRAALKGATLAPAGAAPITRAANPRQAAPNPAPAVFAIGGGARPDLSPAGRWTEDRDAADLIWDRIAGEVVDNVGGDLIAEARDPGKLRDVLEKWRAAKDLTSWAPRKAFDFTIRPGDGRHRLGTRLSLHVARPAGAAAYLTIVNLASGGEAQFVYPDATALRFDDDLIPPGEGPVDLGAFEAAPPVGADHVIALMTPERPEALHRWLISNPSAADVVRRFRTEVEGAPEARIGVVPIFTGR